MLKFSKVGLLNMVADLKDSDKLTLVGDHGVYIMSFAHESTKDDPRPLVYAEGCDPEVDENFYDNKVDLYGGDDGGDEICTVSDLKRILGMCQNYLCVKLTETRISLVTDIKHPVKKTEMSADLVAILPPELRKYVS